jgi:hypothetical protein
MLRNKGLKDKLQILCIRMIFNGQAGQDCFIMKVLKNKKNGYFLEIGSNDPKNINNTYILEKDYNWRGIMVEYDPIFLESYKKERPNSIHVIDDATKIDYLSILKNNNFPTNMDYLQIDLEVSNSSTLNTLELLNNTIMNEYKFAVVTFEHDIYRGDHYNTRIRSREIFNNNGYIRVFSDVKNDDCPFEDWYIHPDLVDKDIINKIKSNDSMDYKDVLDILNSNI